MKQEKVARRYAIALYTLAKSKNYLTEMLDSLDVLKKSLETSKDLSSFISSPEYSNLEKEKIVKKVYEGKLEKHLFSFVLFLIEKGRLNYIDSIIDQIEVLKKEDSSILDASLLSAKEFDNKQKELLKEKLSKKYGKNINLECAESKDLIAGFVVKINDVVIDCSIKNQLELLEESLVL